MSGLYQLKIVCDTEKKVRYAAFSSLAAACKAYRGLKGQNVLLEEKLRETPYIYKGKEIAPKGVISIEI